MKNLSNDLFNEFKKDKKAIQNIAYSHGVKTKHGIYKKCTFYPIDYIVTDEQIKEAKTILQNFKNEELEQVKKDNETIFFVNMGMSFIPSEDKTGKNQKYIGNYRIRAFFKNNDDVLCFVEFGTQANKEFLRCDFSIYNYNDEENKYNYNKMENIENGDIKYTEENILQLIKENFNADFKKIVFTDILTTEEIKKIL